MDELEKLPDGPPQKKAANRIALFSGEASDYDGAYDWVKESEYGLPENSLGFHECYPGPSYTVLEVL